MVERVKGITEVMRATGEEVEMVKIWEIRGWTGKRRPCRGFRSGRRTGVTDDSEFIWISPDMVVTNFEAMGVSSLRGIPKCLKMTMRCIRYGRESLESLEGVFGSSLAISVCMVSRIIKPRFNLQ